MILDTSAVLAIIFREPDFGVLLDKIGSADIVAIGAPTAAETAIILEARLGAAGPGVFIRLLHDWAVAIVPFGEDHWKQAADAYARFGRGKHKAALNFGDCLSYAVASLADQPLLCVGNDFSRTDVSLVNI